MKRDIRSVNDSARILIDQIDRCTARCRDIDRRSSRTVRIYVVATAALVGIACVERVVYVRTELIVQLTAYLVIELLYLVEHFCSDILDTLHQLGIAEPVAQLGKHSFLSAVVRGRDTARHADRIDRACRLRIDSKTVCRNGAVFVDCSRTEERCRLLVCQTACRTCRVYCLRGAVFAFDLGDRIVCFFCFRICFIMVDIDDACHIVDFVFRQCQTDTDRDITAHAESARDVRDRRIVERIELDTFRGYLRFIIDEHETVAVAEHQVSHAFDTRRTAHARLRHDTDLHHIVIGYDADVFAFELCAFGNHDDTFRIESLDRDTASDTDITACTAGETACDIDRLCFALRFDIEISACIDNSIFTDDDTIFRADRRQVHIARDRGFGTARVVFLTACRIVDRKVAVIAQVRKRSRFGKDILDGNKVHHLEIRAHVFTIESQSIGRLTELHRKIEELRIFKIVGIFCRFFICFCKELLHVFQL